MIAVTVYDGCTHTPMHIHVCVNTHTFPTPTPLPTCTHTHTPVFGKRDLTVSMSLVFSTSAANKSQAANGDDASHHSLNVTFSWSSDLFCVSFLYCTRIGTLRHGRTWLMDWSLSTAATLSRVNVGSVDRCKCKRVMYVGI